MGHTSAERGAMNSFRPNATKFPNGWAPLLARRNPEKIRWMGLWHYFTGSNNGLSPNNDFPEGLRQHLEPFSEWSLMPCNDPASALAFYRVFMGSVKAYGFDFVKTDFQSMELARLAGKVDNAVQRCAANSQAFDASLEELGLGLINCNWHNPVNFFNCRFSNIGRSSIDYDKNSLPSAKQHLYQSYANALWLCQLAWGDHDMFHSSHEGVGRIMAVSKAMSGAPVYLSDPPEAFVADSIRPLCYADGELLRPAAPAAPLPDSVFVAPLREETPYRVVAPLADGSATVVVYNLFGKGRESATLQASVTAADFASAGGGRGPVGVGYAVGVAAGRNRPAGRLEREGGSAGRGRRLRPGRRGTLQGRPARRKTRCDTPHHALVHCQASIDGWHARGICSAGMHAHATAAWACHPAILHLMADRALERS